MEPINETDTSNPRGIIKRLGNKILGIIILFLILLVWIIIFSFLIKFDVGGFGSTLRPIIKDVPIISKILPNTKEDKIAKEENYPYQSLEDAANKILELEELNKDLTKEKEEYEKTIEDLEADMSAFKDLQENSQAFRERILEFDKKVVFSEEAPDIKEYKKFYESIEAENAKIIYEEVVNEIKYSQDLKKKVDIYSKMKPKAAASIFESLSKDTGLLVDILSQMDSESASKILAEMNAKLAGELTKELFVEGSNR